MVYNSLYWNFYFPDIFFITNIENVEKDSLKEIGPIKKYTLFDVGTDDAVKQNFLEAIKYMVTISPGMPDFAELLAGGHLEQRVRDLMTSA